ncbi:MAG: Mut7-C ubiquitin/RNAse domain-containing protein, partial [Spirochaetes bacterium]|nr:Mut7-C ubiquitin/RNAse domain-containing protein [Spirochaetota bacterium]
MMKEIAIRFYQELNDFLPEPFHKTKFSLSAPQDATIKNIIESQGVPHCEVDLVLVNGKSVDLNYIPQPHDEVSVYPVFESFDITGLQKIHLQPLRNTRFILDVHLGKLTKNLRLCGFDCYYENHLDDQIIVEIAVREQRIILTRDIGLLKRRAVERGYWLRSTNPIQQLKEVIKRFQL